jgi:hypothetical protein
LERETAYDPAYEVRLVRDSQLGEPRRKDVTTTARGGFLEVTSDLLRQIDVLHRGTLVTRYDLGYIQGAFGKTMLATVARAGSDGQVYSATTFKYFDDVRPDGTHYQGFAPTQSWSTGTDSLTDDVRGPQPVSALGGSTETDGGAHAYLGFNPTDPLKDGSFGGSFGFKIGASEAKAEFIDINGDGLPDKVFYDDQGIAFRLNQSGPETPATQGTFGPKQHITGLPKLSGEETVQFGGGPEGVFRRRRAVQHLRSGDHRRRLLRRRQ